MQTAATSGRQPPPDRRPTTTDGYGDPDHDDEAALGVEVPTAVSRGRESQ